tara:strand:- start:242 stop:574 length:333 start_codon:yes stop_codon:yes gene_type:complete
MAYKIETTINSLEVQYALSGLNNVVISVRYNLSGYDTSAGVDTSSVLFKNCITDVASPTLSSFTAYNNLTETLVLKFMETGSYPSRVTSLKNAIDLKTVAPTKGISAVPW